MAAAQNATGNWIKIVQTGPGGINIHAQELAPCTVRVGLSTLVKRHLARQAARVAAQQHAESSIAQYPVYDRPVAEAGDLITRLIIPTSVAAQGQHST
ncbi:hypothetical protein [Pseudomonas gessardii]|uniref:hypothetical protein n=1 Tax=Pseudomonas gessardii TaxID=78544 RepID=UPI001FD23E61|nr:hypothetical protein [Pseudomonas gessardii]